MIKKILNNPDLKFIAVFLLAVAGFSCSIFALAVIVDPYNIFGLNIFRPILLTNRSEKMNLLQNAGIKPEAVILGSSRIFKMDPAKVENLTGLKTFNASVSYARPEDHLALSKYIVKDLGITPKIFIVGLNTGEFNNDQIDSQTINNSSLRKYLNINKKTLILTLLSTFKERFNSNYLRDIFITIFWNSHGFPNPVITFDRNGGEVFDRNKHPDPKDIEITENIAYGLFKDLPSLSAERKYYFEQFLEFTKENKIQVDVLILPLPTSIQKKLEETTEYEKVSKELLEQMREWEKNFGIKVFNFSGVKKFGGLEDDFDDSTHPSHKNIDLMTEVMLKGFKL